MPSSLNIASTQLPSIDLPKRNWQKWLSAAISLLLLVSIARQLGHIGTGHLLAAIPSSIGFWLALACYYLTLPASEWIIFRRLWRLPAEGFAALLRKLVSNEILLGYSGELTFYTWARRHSGLTAAPFGAIKDVSILSALAGNIATLAMLALAWPLLTPMRAGITVHNLALSIIAMLVVSIGVGLFNRRIFSLPAEQLRFVLMVHVARVVMTTILSGILWHCALPGVPLSMWIILATLQLVVTRLPLVPSKDIVFAGAAMILVGPGSDVAHLIAVVAGLILAAHLVVGLALLAAEAIAEAQR